MAKILIPTALRQFTEEKDAVDVNGGTVAEALTQLTAQYPNIKKNLFNDQGRLRSFVNVYVNDEDIRYLDKDATKLEGTETISIVPSIAGGAIGVAEPAAVSLSNEEIARYSRHLLLPEVGMEGQLKLKQAKVALIGAGGLGAPLGLYLAAAGIGRIGVVDFDVVDSSNLQRQVIHGTSDIGRKKLDSAADRMRDINPNVRIDKFDTGLTSENALEILKDYDIVVDGTDNFPTRYLVNDACVLLKKPNVYGSIFRFEGQATVFAYEDGPCYRCLYPEPPPPGLVPSCAEGGVLGILPGAIGVIQATETVKLILGVGETLKGRLLLYDALNMRFRELKLRRDRNCPVCGDHPTVTKLIDYQEFCGIRPTPPQAAAPIGDVIDVTEVKQKLDRGDSFVLIDVREPYEYQIARIPGAKLIPLGELPKRLSELDRDADTVMHCRSGARSQKAVDLLKQNGFKHVRNMTGGILAWSDKVDPSVPKY
ncbi:MAG: molybdopterin-synthase adenylyltransferase MoeB [Acidobacteriaceae bacterium]|nr:molybdopterin-synthase adenylyltransferase MoeB [Acidobacteriaceae bacterium]